MKENVGRTDQVVRAVFGPLLLGAGYAMLGGKDGRPAGIMTMIAGALVTETAITKTCPLNAAFGIDTTEAAGEFAGAEMTGMETEGAEVEGVGRRGERIDYSNFVNAAASLSFIGNQETAESAVKAVLGILASRLDEREAMRLITSLPDPLSYENLRGHQANVTDLSVEQYYSSLASQFHISPEQAQVLAVTILRLVKEALDTEGIREIEQSLPDEWTELIERV